MNKQNMFLICATVLLASSAFAQQDTPPPVQQPSYTTDGQQDTYSYSLPDTFDEKQTPTQQERSAEQNNDEQQRKLLIQNIRQLYHDQSAVLAP